MLAIKPETQIQLHLKSLLDLESISYDEESIALIADSAQGSVRSISVTKYMKTDAKPAYLQQ